MRSRSSEPLSPELVLVAPVDEAQRAREELSDDASWDEFLGGLRSRAQPTVDEEVEEETWEQPRRRSRARLLAIALGLLVLILAGVGAAWWAGDRSHETGPSRAAPAAVLPTVATPKPAQPRAHTTRQPRPATNVQPKRSKPRPRKTPHPAARATFSPARVFSWPVARGSRYRVRFWRNGTKVLDVRTAKPRLVLPRTFVFKPGRYRWMVVAVRGGTRRSLVDSAFVVAKS